MLAEERKQIILKIINEKNAVRVGYLANKLNITEATVRRDLDDLQNENKIKRTHGGAVSLFSAMYTRNIDENRALHHTEKVKIAQRAYEFLEDKDVILMDNATTIYELATLIRAGNTNGRKLNLTVITHSFTIVSELSGCPGIDLIQIGGRVDPQRNMAVGTLAEGMLSRLRADKVFLGTSAFDSEFGYAVDGIDEASIKSCMLKLAKEKFVLTVHTKFNNTALARFARPEGDIDIVISDYFPESIAEFFDSSDTQLLLAN